jgi:hypothetical protein
MQLELEINLEDSLDTQSIFHLIIVQIFNKDYLTFIERNWLSVHRTIFLRSNYGH